LRTWLRWVFNSRITVGLEHIAFLSSRDFRRVATPDAARRCGRRNMLWKLGGTIDADLALAKFSLYCAIPRRVAEGSVGFHVDDGITRGHGFQISGVQEAHGEERHQGRQHACEGIQDSTLDWGNNAEPSLREWRDPSVLAPLIACCREASRPTFPLQL